MAPVAGLSGLLEGGGIAEMVLMVGPCIKLYSDASPKGYA